MDILLRLVPVLGLLLTAITILFNVAKDVFDTQRTPTGIGAISVDTYKYASPYSELVREWITRLSTLNALTSVAVGITMLLFLYGLEIRISTRSGFTLEPLSPSNVVTFVISLSILTLLLGAIVAHAMMVVRLSGPTQK